MYPEDLHLATGGLDNDNEGANIESSDTSEVQENYLRRKSANSQAMPLLRYV